jgi:L-ascorbate metabolism protein UlaG (beta-lactamase superfamily)
MRVEWYGQSAFRLSDGEQAVMIDPLGDLSLISRPGTFFNYPAIAGVDAHALLVTHEHRDHNHVEAIGGDPVLLRSTAGRFSSPIGEVVGIASEHDEQAGTERGANVIFAFEFDGLRVCHFGDFGQRALREEQAAAIGSVDLLFIPVGGHATIEAERAWSIVERLSPRWAVPMHYRTPRISFLETEEAFVALASHVERLGLTAFETSELAPCDGPLVVVPAAP